MFSNQFHNIECFFFILIKQKQYNTFIDKMLILKFSLKSIKKHPFILHILRFCYNFYFYNEFSID